MNDQIPEPSPAFKGLMYGIAFGVLMFASMVSGSAHAATAFFSHETYSGGLTKQCHYKYLNETYTITVSNVSLCPLSIEV